MLGEPSNTPNSAAWLAFGVALSVAGVWLRSQAVRFASAAAVVFTVLEVFLIGMHDLTGVFRGFPSSVSASCCSASAGSTSACCFLAAWASTLLHRPERALANRPILLGN